MNYNPEDLRLTAYVLGESTPQEAAEIEKALAADPQLAEAVREMRRVQRELNEALAPSAPALLPAQRESIHRAAREASLAGVRPAAHPRWLLPMALAAAAVVAVVVLRHPHAADDDAAAVNSDVSRTSAAAPSPATPAPVSQAPGNKPTATPPVSREALPLAAAVLPLPGPPSPATPGIAPQPAGETLLAAARDRDKVLRDSPADFFDLTAKRLAAAGAWDPAGLPEVDGREAVSTATTAQLPLPVLAGRASLGWISSSVLDKSALPPAKAVRLEELLNAFTLIPVGTSAVSKGVSLSAEPLSCPWKPSATLLLVRIQGAADGPRSVEMTLDAAPAAVSQFRLLGFSPVEGLERETPSTVLPPRMGTSLLIQLESRANEKTLGEIRWKIDGKDAAPLPVVRVPDAEPSDDARFAALLAAWSMWLTDESPAVVDTELVGSIGRECAAATLPEDRAKALVLIAKSLEIEK